MTTRPAGGSPRRRGRVWALAALAVLLWPSGHAHSFDGLPLSSLHEYALLLWWLPFLFSRGAASHLGLVLRRLPTAVLPVAATTAVAVKLLMAGAGIHTGFPAVYGSPLAPPARAHEVSYENPLTIRTMKGLSVPGAGR